MDRKRWEVYGAIAALKPGKAIKFGRNDMRELCKLNQTGFDLLLYMTDQDITEEILSWEFFTEFTVHYDPACRTWEMRLIAKFQIVEEDCPECSGTGMPTISLSEIRNPTRSVSDPMITVCAMCFGTGKITKSAFD